MEIHIKIGGVTFGIDTEFEFTVETVLAPFLCEKKDVCDVKVKVGYTKNKIAEPQGYKKGEDLLQEFYVQEELLRCMAKGGISGYLSETVCKRDFSELDCCIQYKHVESLKTLGNILRLLPMCMIFQEKGVLLFHASQIEFCGKGILFTAPSGTGKTTQAKLWRQYRNARIICNDRTLVRKGRTYGYPVDGSEPVRSSEVLPLGAVVVLAQGEENAIRRLTPKEALKMVMPQLVIASWDPMYRVAAMEEVVALMEHFPIYFLSCRPEESAVQCLEEQLLADGVIERAVNCDLFN